MRLGSLVILLEMILRLSNELNLFLYKNVESCEGDGIIFRDGSICIDREYLGDHIIVVE